MLRRWVTITRHEIVLRRSSSVEVTAIDVVAAEICQSKIYDEKRCRFFVINFCAGNDLIDEHHETSSLTLSRTARLLWSHYQLPQKYIKRQMSCYVTERAVSGVKV